MAGTHRCLIYQGSGIGAAAASSSSFELAIARLSKRSTCQASVVHFLFQRRSQCLTKAKTGEKLLLLGIQNGDFIAECAHFLLEFSPDGLVLHLGGIDSMHHMCSALSLHCPHLLLPCSVLVVYTGLNGRDGIIHTVQQLQNLLPYGLASSLLRDVFGEVMNRR